MPQGYAMQLVRRIMQRIVAQLVITTATQHPSQTGKSYLHKSPHNTLHNMCTEVQLMTAAEPEDQDNFLLVIGTLFFHTHVT